jgi:hypothetical protein
LLIKAACSFPFNFELLSRWGVGRSILAKRWNYSESGVCLHIIKSVEPRFVQPT